MQMHPIAFRIPAGHSLLGLSRSCSPAKLRQFTPWIVKKWVMCFHSPLLKWGLNCFPGTYSSLPAGNLSSLFKIVNSKLVRYCLAVIVGPVLTSQSVGLTFTLHRYTSLHLQTSTKLYEFRDSQWKLQNSGNFGDLLKSPYSHYLAF